MLTWIHLYAFARTSAATSVRIYCEAARAKDFDAVADPAQHNACVPLGVSIFPRELAVLPELYVLSCFVVV